MDKFFLILFFNSCCWMSAQAQMIIRGRVLTQSDKNPIAYANIGIPGTGVGTISNTDGTFSMRIPEANATDTILFSAVGYGRRKVPVQSFVSGEFSTVYLVVKITMLDMITITGEKEKPKEFSFGNRYFRGGYLKVDSVYAGATYALLIENKHPSFNADFTFPAYFQKVKFRVFKNNFRDFKFRVRIFDVDALTKEPGRDLLEQSIVVSSRKKQGWIEVDLSHVNLKITGPFFIGYEWILNDADRTAIYKGFENYRKLNPGKITRTTGFLDGEKIEYENINWSEFPGTAINVSPLQFSRDNYKSFVRESSFSKWNRANLIMTVRVTMSDIPAGLADKDAPIRLEGPCEESLTTCHVIKLCKTFLEDNSVNGIQLTVSKKGEIRFSSGFGMSDITNNVPVTSSTRFRVGSVSKTLTSAAIAKLVADGKLDLNAPIQKYAPFPEKKFIITSRQLAGHTAGIRHYRLNDPQDLIRSEHYRNATQALKIFDKDTLLFKPGTDYHYSSFGWNLLGAVIEGASGQPYLTYMEEKIWKPLNMPHTYGDLADSLMPDRSKFYDFTGEEARPEDLSYKYPSGGLLSTTEDLVRFGNEMLHPRYLDPAVTRSLFEVQYLANRQATTYGLGWNIGRDRNGHRIWFHVGELSSGSAYLILYPDDDIVIAFAANSQEGVDFEIQKIAELFYQD